MLSRRSVAFSLFVMPILAQRASAVEKAFFTRDAFDKAQRDGKTVLVDVWASWCPTCKAQQNVLEKLSQNPKFEKLVILSMDFDVQKDDLKFFKATHQSTLIVFKGTTEVARSSGVTNAGAIEAMISQAL